IVYKPVDLSKV
nr:Chain A, HUMAN TAU PEPTIDE A8119 RESIDUES 299-318 [Homo sapiens]